MEELKHIDSDVPLGALSFPVYFSAPSSAARFTRFSPLNTYLTDSCVCISRTGGGGEYLWHKIKLDDYQELG